MYSGPHANVETPRSIRYLLKCPGRNIVPLLADMTVFLFLLRLMIYGNKVPRTLQKGKTTSQWSNVILYVTSVVLLFIDITQQGLIKVEF